MGKYVIKRLLFTILVIVGAGIVIFTAMYFVPGDPAALKAGATATPEEIELQRALMGLDKPLLEQLGSFLYNTFLRFDMGISWTSGQSVFNAIVERLPRSLLLGVITAFVAAVIGIPLGVTAATHRGKWQDRGLMVGTMVFVSIPEFLVALSMILFFALYLQVLPSRGIESWKCYIMPVISGALLALCNIARQSRASMLDVVRADYVTTARAKGMKERAIIYKHMLPNAMIPIITVCGNYFARCVGGTIVLEKIFSFPGIGLLLNSGINERDYPMIRGCVVVMAAYTAIMMLIVDLAYAFVDPRIKSQYVNSAKRKGSVPSRHKQNHAHGGNHHHHNNDSGHGGTSLPDAFEDETVEQKGGDAS